MKGEITFIRKDGLHFPAEISAILIVDENNNKQTSMTIRGIIDHKQVENSLIDTNIKFEAIIESMTMPYLY